MMRHRSALRQPVRSAWLKTMQAGQPVKTACRLLRRTSPLAIRAFVAQ
jgi:hypothetical protein